MGWISRSSSTDLCSLPKLGGVYPPARRYCAPHAGFTTLLMSTGLTFGTISSLCGLQAGIITETQFSLLIGTIALSAIVPTAIAQRFLQPNADTEQEAETTSAGHAREPETDRPGEVTA